MGIGGRGAPVNLTTRCPNCGTAFRVQPVQLSARGGKVRCGKCANVFDGVAALVAEGPAAQNAGTEPEAEPSPQLALFEAAKKLPPLAGASDAANEDAPAPEFLDESPPPKRRVGWLLAALLALLVLLAHAAYYFRTEIAVMLPAMRPHLEAACTLLGCEVRLPRYGNLVRIESSELRRHVSGERIVQLDATFRNFSPLAQEYPSLILTLTNSKDEVVARRAISPQEYLQSKSIDVARSGFPGDSVMDIHIYFDSGEIDAFGYRLALAYL